MKKKAYIIAAIVAGILAMTLTLIPMRKVKAAGVVDQADWNKKKVTVTLTNDYTKYTQTSQYTLDSVGVWQWGKKDSQGRYSVYFDASDVKKVAWLYENDRNIPGRYAANCALHDKTVEALR